MKTIKRDDGYWITEIHPEAGDCGPWPTKAEADEHRHALQRTLDHLDDRTFWTTER
jgi:hypothetical protein